MKGIIIFASGKGTNVERIIRYFQNDPQVEVAALFTDKPGCGASLVSEKYGVPTFNFSSTDLKEGRVLARVKEINPELIVLAGFLKLLPIELIRSFKDKIINIHPALLPKFGGKGFYGKYVHEAVLNAKEKTTGITIHWVDEEYDKGKIIIQKECDVEENDTVDTLTDRIRKLEHEVYPQVIEELLRGGGKNEF